MSKKIIKEIVENYFKIDIATKTRVRQYVEARAIYYKLLRDNTRMSLATIGKTMNRDHATALHSIRKIEDWLEYDRQLKQDYKTLNSRVQHAIKLNPDLFNDVESIEDFYEVEYKKLEKKYDQLTKRNTKEYSDIVTKYNFLKSRLERYEPRRVERGEFDLV
tara:strand:- start:263 stop:748 length:486 start_codon:yes stop_codon:yes gene_type:complete